MLDIAVFYATAPVFIIAALAMPAGIGGGLLYVPLLVTMNVVSESRKAAALGQPLICGATLAAVTYNLAWQRRHPEKRLVRTELALAAIPACLAGALAGAVLNQVLPDVLIHVLLLLVLLSTLRTTGRKALAMWRQESKDKFGHASSQQPPETLGASVEDGAAGTVDRATITTSVTASLPNQSDDGGVQAMETDSREAARPRCCWFGPVGWLMPSAMSFAPATPASTSTFSSERSSIGPAEDDTPHSAFSAFPSATDEAALAAGPGGEGVRRRGSSSSHAGTATGFPAASQETNPNLSPALVPTARVYESGAHPVTEEAVPEATCFSGLLRLFGIWVVLLATLVVRGGKGAGSLVGVEYCSWEYWLITGFAFTFLLVVEVFTRRPEFPAVPCFLVGCLSSVVGMGGGVVLNPMLLGAGFEPVVATATVTVMIVMVSSSATVNFVLLGAVPVVPTLVLFACAFLGSMCGKTIVGWLVSKTGRNSFLVILLAGFIAVSTVVVCVQGILQTASTISQGDNPLMLWSGLCS